jgi:uncharacterized phage protein gp47/JayE
MAKTLEELCYIDGAGFHAPDFADVLAFYQDGYKAIYGDDVYLEPDSQDGQWLAFQARAAFDAIQLAQSVYRSFSPATAQGDAMSVNVKINGLRRFVPSNSSVDLLVSGTIGTQITNGEAEDQSGNRWMLPALVTIADPGQVTVTATAKQAGDINAQAGSITKIATPTRGWTAVTNPLPAVPGDPSETDAELRRRQAISTMLPSRSVMEGIVGAVAKVNGVRRLRGYENDTNVTDANGVPGHTIAIVAEGGDAVEIATTIALEKTAGTGTFARDAAHFDPAIEDRPDPLPGGTTIEVPDEYGVLDPISFIRPTPVPIRVLVTITTLPNFVTSTEDAIRTRIADYLEGLAIGEQVYLNRLYTPANLEDAATGATFFVDSIEISRDPEAVASANIPLAFNEVATCDAVANVTVEHTP